MVQQAAVEERPDFEDPVRFVIRTWPWPDQPEGLPQVQELIRNPLLMWTFIYTAMMLSIEELLLFAKSTLTLELVQQTRLCTGQTHKRTYLHTQATPHSNTLTTPHSHTLSNTHKHSHTLSTPHSGSAQSENGECASPRRPGGRRRPFDGHVALPPGVDEDQFCSFFQTM